MYSDNLQDQREADANTDIMCLLLAPLQRIPKYMLQLQQVLKHTREDHADYFNLQASLSKLQDFVERFNHDITHSTQAIALDQQHIQSVIFMTLSFFLSVPVLL